MDNEKEKRLEELERRVAALEAVQRGVIEPRLPPVPASRPLMVDTPAREPRDIPVPRRPKRDWEALVGRYGTLLLATVSVLAAVGTFIGWAISKGWLGPTPRVVLGLIAAAALAVAGLRLRRTERSFGSSILGLSLAVVHVCAWGAGPALDLVPQSVAFGLAALASAALALLARIEGDEPLWCVGFVGASIAPFVTATGEGSMPVLAAYGAMVLAASGHALGDRDWRVAGRLFGLTATLYVAALMLGTTRDNGPLLALALPLVVGFVAVLPWTGGIARRDRLRPLGALAALAALRAGYEGTALGEEMGLALEVAGAGVAWLVLVDLTAVFPAPVDDTTRRRIEGDWVDAGLVPIAFVIAILVALAAPQPSATVLAMAAAVLLGPIFRHREGALRDAAVVAATLSAVGAVVQLSGENQIALISGVAAVGAACFAANLWRPSRSWIALGLVTQAWSMLAAITQLNERTPYRYTPLVGPASAVSAWVSATLLTSRKLVGSGETSRLLLGGAVVWAFAWLHQEISFAFNPTAATLLRVSYYALTSVAAVWVGRAQRVAILRHVGLGLAVIAAGTALYSARNLTSTGARIFADLVAAAFLLAIAFWYRKPGSSSPAVDPGGEAARPST